MSGTGVYGIGQYTQRGSGYDLQARNRPGWAVLAWQANDAKITSVR
jgi:hypothetical protein